MRMVDKTYWVLVEGHVRPRRATWRDFLRKVPGEARAEIVMPDHAESRLAILHYHVRRYEDYGSWLEVRLETGRTHQIRLQCSSRGHPVLGDGQYGSTRPFGPQREDHRDRWIGLHARQLGFTHPKTREPVIVTAPVPAPWLELRSRWDGEVAADLS
jgi:23S rRNA-/tRNA-specific pseudouridylate synthase